MRKAAIVFLILAAAAAIAIWAKLGQSNSPPQYVPRRPGTLTFSKDIAPIIFHNCSGCHRPSIC